MAWVATAISIGNAVYGAVESGKASRDAKRSSDEANRIAESADQASLDFAKQQYNDWQDTFGPVQDNLSEYYQNLSPTTMTAQKLEAFELEKDTMLTSLRENLEQRGLATSGAQTQVETDVEIASLGQRAKIRAEAPAQVAQEKLSFLNAGLGNDGSTNMQNTLNQQASGSGSRALLTGRLAGDARVSDISSRANLVNTLGEGATNWWDNRQNNKAASTPSAGG